MITVDINKRYTARDVLEDQWITNLVENDQIDHMNVNHVLCENSIDSIKKFKAKSLLKRELISILVR